MIKYFLIYTEVYTTTLSEEDFYKRFLDIKYDYTSVERKQSKMYLSFRNSLSAKKYDAMYLRTVSKPSYLKTVITFIPKMGKSVVTVRYKPDYLFIIMATIFLVGLMYVAIITNDNTPHTEVVKGILNNKPHTFIFRIKDSWICISMFLLILIFLLAEIYNYFKAKKWLKKHLSLSVNHY